MAFLHGYNYRGAVITGSSRRFYDIVRILYQDIFAYTMTMSEFFSRIKKYFLDKQKDYSREQAPSWFSSTISSITFFGNKLFNVNNDRVSLVKSEEVIKIIRMANALDMFCSAHIDSTTAKNHVKEANEDYTEYTELIKSAKKELLECFNDHAPPHERLEEKRNEKNAYNTDVDARLVGLRSILQFRSDINKETTYDFKSIISKIKHKIKSEKDKIQSAKEEMNEQKNKLKAEEEEHKYQQAALHPLQEENSKLKSALKNVKNTYQYTAEYVNQLRAEHDKRVKQLDSQKDELFNEIRTLMQQQLNDKEEKIQGNQYNKKETERLCRENEKLIHEKQQLKNEKQQLKNEINKLKNVLKQSQKARKKQSLNDEKEKQHLKDENETLKVQLEEMMKMRNEFAEAVHNVEYELITTRKQLFAAEKNLINEQNKNKILNNVIYEMKQKYENKHNGNNYTGYGSNCHGNKRKNNNDAKYQSHGDYNNYDDHHGYYDNEYNKEQQYDNEYNKQQQYDNKYNKQQQYDNEYNKEQQYDNEYNNNEQQYDNTYNNNDNNNNYNNNNNNDNNYYNNNEEYDYTYSSDDTDDHAHSKQSEQAPNISDEFAKLNLKTTKYDYWTYRDTAAFVIMVCGNESCIQVMEYICRTMDPMKRYSKKVTEIKQNDQNNNEIKSLWHQFWDRPKVAKKIIKRLMMRVHPDCVIHKGIKKSITDANEEQKMLNGILNWLSAIMAAAS